MAEYDYEEALTALEALRAEVALNSITHRANGVCFYLTDHIGYRDGYEFVADHSDDWPHGLHWTPEECAKMGDTTVVGKLKDYFVPHTPGYGFWEGPNRELRLDLIEFLIEKCRAALAS